MVKMLAGPPVDLSAYQGQPLDRDTLRGATATIMTDITKLLQQLRGGTPPQTPYHPAIARRAARQEAREAQAEAADAPEAAEAPGAPDGEKAAPA
jgi:hypothetical protein